MDASWPYYVDKTVFGEQYNSVHEVSSQEEWETRLRPAFAEKQTHEWLVLAGFQVLWSKDASKVMDVLQELAPSQPFPVVTFVSVRADSQSMMAVSKSLKVSTFPTVVLFRGGKEVQRVVGPLQLSQRLTKMLADNITDADGLAYDEYCRLEEERMQAEGKEIEKEVEAVEELEWIWDAEEHGKMFDIDEQGLRVVMRQDDTQDGEKVHWEYEKVQYDWVNVGPELSKALEAGFKSGQFYSNRSLSTDDGRGCYAYCSSDHGMFEITGYYCDISRGCGYSLMTMNKKKTTSCGERGRA